jgi:hypothetical protein
MWLGGSYDTSRGLEPIDICVLVIVLPMQPLSPAQACQAFPFPQAAYHLDGIEDPPCQFSAED